MKSLILALFAALMLTSCVVYADPPVPPLHPEYGCVVVEDDYGEREVCGAYYYMTPGGAIYWDAAMGVWIGAGGYWYGGIWHHGYWPGYWARYHVFYHNHGFYHGEDHHWGGYHGGGEYHGGGGYHGGGHSGGHGGGHR